MSISCIYLIFNVANGKCYIGSALNFKKRKSKHLTELRGNYHHSLYLQRAYNKYGENSFKFFILENVLVKWKFYDF